MHFNCLYINSESFTCSLKKLSEKIGEKYANSLNQNLKSAFKNLNIKEIYRLKLE